MKINKDIELNQMTINTVLNHAVSCYGKNVIACHEYYFSWKVQ